MFSVPKTRTVVPSKLRKGCESRNTKLSDRLNNWFKNGILNDSGYFAICSLTSSVKGTTNPDK